MEGAIASAPTRSLRERRARSCRSQFDNPANPRVHARARRRARSSHALAGERIDAFVAGVGTGGTISGVGRVLKRHRPAPRVIAVEPEACATISRGERGPTKIQGIGAGFVPENYDAVGRRRGAHRERRDAYETKVAPRAARGPAGRASARAPTCASRSTVARELGAGQERRHRALRHGRALLQPRRVLRVSGASPSKRVRARRRRRPRLRPRRSRSRARASRALALADDDRVELTQPAPADPLHGRRRRARPRSTRLAERARAERCPRARGSSVARESRVASGQRASTRRGLRRGRRGDRQLRDAVPARRRVRARRRARRARRGGALDRRPSLAVARRGRPATAASSRTSRAGRARTAPRPASSGPVCGVRRRARRPNSRSRCCAGDAVGAGALCDLRRPARRAAQRAPCRARARLPAVRRARAITRSRRQYPTTTA